MRQANGAMKSAREMEGSVSVSAYMRATTGKRLDPLLLPSSRPHVPPRNTLRDMDVQELGSPGHPRSNRALSCVAFSKKRKTRALARGTMHTSVE